MKRMTTFKHFLILSASTALITGCGARKDGNTGAVGYSTLAEISQIQDLQPSERDIATRICYAYRSKNINFRTPTYTGKYYDFSMSTKNCKEERNNYALITTIKASTGTDQGLSFVPVNKSTQAFLSKIQTSSSGFLAQLCEKIQNNQVISNTIEDEDAGITVQISFFKDDLDAYKLNYFAKDTKGKMSITSAETFKVRTQFNLNANQILGMDEIYLKQTTCEDSKHYTEFTQLFSGSRSQ